MKDQEKVTISELIKNKIAELEVLVVQAESLGLTFRIGMHQKQHKSHRLRSARVDYDLTETKTIKY